MHLPHCPCDEARDFLEETSDSAATYTLVQGRLTTTDIGWATAHRDGFRMLAKGGGGGGGGGGVQDPIGSM